MTTHLLVDAFQRPTQPDFDQSPIITPPEREVVRVVIFSSKTGVNSTILTLHKLNFAHIHEWSPLLPSSNPGEVMSILTRYLITR